MKAGFESEQLNARQIIAFQQKAKQLVADFIAYYDLLRNNELDADLRAEVIKEMQALFSSETDTIVLDQIYQVSELASLSFSQLPDYKLSEVLAVEVPVRPGFQQLTFLLAIQLADQTGTKPATALLNRTTKSFGTRSLSVWDVQLTSLSLGLE